LEDYINGVKPRYDGRGSEFGLIHRDLGPKYLMFDIDGLTATVETELKIRRQDEGFVEYRYDGKKVDFIALFEIKAHKTKYSIKAIDPCEINSIAKIEMARRLGARLFVGFGTNGKQPFDFYEINITTGQPCLVGTLNYKSDNRISKVKSFWSDILRIVK
jgi:hypothetical protein